MHILKLHITHDFICFMRNSAIGCNNYIYSLYINRLRFNRHKRQLIPTIFGKNTLI